MDSKDRFDVPEKSVLEPSGWDNRVNELLKYHEKYHSTFQMTFAIVARSGVTRYGMFKQALREIRKRTGVLKQHEFRARMLQAKIDRDGPPKNTVSEVKLDRRKWILENIDECVTHCKRELETFVEIATMLKEDLGELTPERISELDEEMHLTKIARTVAIERQLLGKVRPGTMENVMCLTSGDQKKVVELARAYNIERKYIGPNRTNHNVLGQMLENNTNGRNKIPIH